MHLTCRERVLLFLKYVPIAVIRTDGGGGGGERGGGRGGGGRGGAEGGRGAKSFICTRYYKRKIQ